MHHLGTTILQTDRLVLRAFDDDDAGDMFRNWATDDEVSRFLTWRPYTEIEDVCVTIRTWKLEYGNPDHYHWAIVKRDIGQVIGSISVVDFSERNEVATIGYCIGRKFWGQGIATEALMAVVKFLFCDVGFACINACHDPRNPKSGRVMIKCGMHYEGIRRRSGYNNLGVCDQVWYSILREEYDSMETAVRC